MSNNPLERRENFGLVGEKKLTDFGADSTYQGLTNHLDSMLSKEPEKGTEEYARKHTISEVRKYLCPSCIGETWQFVRPYDEDRPSPQLDTMVWHCSVCMNAIEIA